MVYEWENADILEKSMTTGLEWQLGNQKENDI